MSNNQTKDFSQISVVHELSNDTAETVSGGGTVALHEHINRGGQYRYVINYSSNLGYQGFNDKTSSITVYSGRWRFFKDADYRNQFSRLLGRGVYNWVEDIGIKNDSLSSLYDANIYG